MNNPSCFHCHQEIIDNNITSFNKCSHNICSSCLIADIIKQQLNSISSSLSQIETLSCNCKCAEGSIEFPFSELQNITLPKYKEMLNVCNIHKHDIEFYCKKCKALHCKECFDESNKELHECININEFVGNVKTSYSDNNIKFQTYNDFETFIDSYYNKFKNEIEIAYDTNIKTCDTLIEQINTLKQKIYNDVQYQLHKQNILTSLIKKYYSNIYANLTKLNSCKSNNDYFIAKQITKMTLNINEFLIEKNDMIFPELTRLTKEVNNIYDNKSLQVTLIYPYFGIIKQFTKLSQFTYHTKKVTGITLIPNTNQIATFSDDKTIKIFDSFSPYNMHSTLEGHTEPITALCAITHQGKQLLISASKDLSIKIWDISIDATTSSLTSQCVQTITEQIELTNHLSALLLPKEGFISSCDDNSVKIWTYNNVINEFEVTQLLDGHENGVTCAIELDNGDIISGSNDMCINVWRIPENGDGVYYECVQPIGGISEVMSLCGFKGKVVAGFKDATIKVFENVNGVYNEIAELSGDNGHKKVINMIIKLKDDRLASCSFDKYIKVWSYNEITKQFGCDQTIRGHMMAVYAITETKDGKMVSVSGDKNVIVWKRERKI